MNTTTAEATETTHDSHGRPAPRYDDINAPVIILVAVISALLTFLTIALVQGMFYHWQSTYLKKRELQYETVNAPAKMEIAEQQAMLDGSKEGLTSIDEAMKQVIAEYGSKKTSTETPAPKTETPDAPEQAAKPADKDH